MSKAQLGYDWLREPMRTRMLQRKVSDVAREPLLWRKSIDRHFRRRALTRCFDNMGIVAQDHATNLVHPFIEPAFHDAMAHAFGLSGPRSRATAMRVLFGDLLPETIVRRSDKAFFNHAVYGPATRAFAEKWRNGGVDESVVDVDRLRSEWLAETPSAQTALLLQSAASHTLGWATSDTSQRIG
jgi:hypothetical protein